MQKMAEAKKETGFALLSTEKIFSIVVDMCKDAYSSDDTVIYPAATNSFQEVFTRLQNDKFSTWSCWSKITQDLKLQELQQEFLSKTFLKRFYKCMNYSCLFSSDDVEKFIGHSQIEHFNENLYCCYCFHGFENGYQLAQHMTTSHGRRMYQCSGCLYRSSTKMHVLFHKNTFHSVKFFRCKLPAGSYVQKKESKVPVKVFKEYCCAIDGCNLSSVNVNVFKNHCCSEHHNAESYPCGYCNFTTPMVPMLLAHYQQHDMYKLECPYCECGSDKKNQIVHHLVLFHPDEDIAIYTRLCDSKDKAFPKDVCVPEFMPNCTKNFFCGDKTCSFELWNMEHYQTHLSTLHHCLEGALPCPHCPKRYKTFDDLEDHVYMHGPNLYGCSNCAFIHWRTRMFQQHFLQQHRFKKCKINVVREFSNHPPPPIASLPCNSNLQDDGILDGRPVSDKHYVYTIDSTEPEFSTGYGSFVEVEYQDSLNSAGDSDCKNSGEESSGENKSQDASEAKKQYICSCCDQVEDTRRELLTHYCIKHKYWNSVSCNLCSEFFVSREDREVHKQLHHSKSQIRSVPVMGKRYQCFACPYNTEIRAHFKEHLFSELKYKPFRCGICNLHTTRPSTLRHHGIKEHDNSNINLCIDALNPDIEHWLQSYLAVARREVEVVEIRQSENGGAYICKICKKPIFTSHLYRFHLYEHLQYQKYVCNNCNDRFHSADEVRKHGQQQHNTDSHRHFKIDAIEEWVEGIVQANTVEDSDCKSSGNCSIGEDGSQGAFQHADQETHHESNVNQTTSHSNSFRIYGNVKETEVSDSAVKVLKNDHVVIPGCSYSVNESLPCQDKLLRWQLIRQPTKSLPNPGKSSGKRPVGRPRKNIDSRSKAKEQFICSCCDKVGDTRRGLLMHCRIKHKYWNAVSCNFCSEFFVSKEIRKVHKRLHHSKSEPAMGKHYQCYACPYKTEYPFHLKEHLFSELKYTPFYCGICSLHSTQPSIVRHHGIKEHNNSDVSLCIDASNPDVEHWLESYLAVARREVEVVQIQEIENGGYICIICKKSILTSDLYRIHLYDHLQYKKYVCHNCDQRFQSIDEVKKHAQQQHKTESHRHFKIDAIEEWVESMVQANTVVDSDCKSNGNCSIREDESQDAFQHANEENNHKRKSSRINDNVKETPAMSEVSVSCQKNGNAVMSGCSYSVNASLPCLDKSPARRWSSIGHPKKNGSSIVSCQPTKNIYIPSSQKNECNKAANMFICSCCDKVKATGRGLLIHYRIKHKYWNAVNCKFCGEFFVSKKVREVHKRLHHSKSQIRSGPVMGNNYRCFACPYKTEFRHHLKEHLFCELKYKPFLCVVCDFSTTRPSLVRHHGEKVHQKSDVCFDASDLDIVHWIKSYVAVSRRKDGVVQTQEVKNGCYMCVMCQKSILSSYRYRIHLYEHLQYKTYTCNSCEERFFAASDVKKHAQEQHNTDSYGHFTIDAIDKWVDSMVQENTTEDLDYKSSGNCSIGEDESEDAFQHANEETNHKSNVNESSSHCNSSRIHDNVKETPAMSEVSDSAVEVSCQKNNNAVMTGCSYSVNKPPTRHWPAIEHPKKNEGSIVSWKPTKNIFIPSCQKNKIDSRNEARNMFICSCCDKVKDSRKGLLIHYRIKHKYCNAVNCNFCSEVFVSKEVRELHKRLHHSKSQIRSEPVMGNNYRCFACPYQTEVPARLKEHLFSELKYKPFICIVCNFTTTRQSVIRHHAKKVHQKTNVGFDASDSDIDHWIKSYIAVAWRKDKVVQAQEIKNGCYMCVMCQKSIVSSYRYRIHLYEHLQYKTYKCNNCEEKFFAASDVKKHTQEQHNTDSYGHFTIDAIEKWVNGMVQAKKKRTKGADSQSFEEWEKQPCTNNACDSVAYSEVQKVHYTEKQELCLPPDLSSIYIYTPKQCPVNTKVYLPDAFKYMNFHPRVKLEKCTLAEIALHNGFVNV